MAKRAQAPLGAAHVQADQGAVAAAAPPPAGIGANPAPEETARLHLPGQANPAPTEVKERADEPRAPAAAGASANAGPPLDVLPPRAAAEVVRQAPAKVEAEKAARDVNGLIPPPAARSAEAARPSAAVRAEARRRVEVQASSLGRLAVPAPAPLTSAGGMVKIRPLLSLLRAMPPQGEGWSWRVGVAGPRAADAALRQWLERLDVAAGDGWQEAAWHGDVQAPGIVLDLLLDGRPRARIQLDADSVRFSDNADAARPLRAALPAPAAQDLRTGLEALAR